MKSQASIRHVLWFSKLIQIDYMMSAMQLQFQAGVATFRFASNTHGIHTILTIYFEVWISRQFDHLPAPKGSNKYILSDNSKILCYVIV